MYESDLLLAFSFMALLFLRQISILKQANKINYAPLMVGIGAISSIVHFIIFPDQKDISLLLRESLLPLLVSLLLYIVMNILHQTQQTQSLRSQDGFAQALASQLAEMKEFMGGIEKRIALSQYDELKAKEEIFEKFKQDMKALEGIKENQSRFLEKIDEFEVWQQSVSNAFLEFSTVQLPELDNVVHKHIDILRIAEQEHHNQLKNMLNKALQSKLETLDEIEALKAQLSEMSRLSTDIADSITEHTLVNLSGVTQSFSRQLLSLKSQTESMGTSLSEDENRLIGIRNQSEMIMKQMILSSKKMDELKEKNDSFSTTYLSVKDLLHDIELIKSDYVKSQSQLSSIAKEMKFSEEEQIEALKTHVEVLSEMLSKKIDDSLEKLHEHYHIADSDISESVKILSKKLQIQKGYTQHES